MSFPYVECPLDLSLLLILQPALADATFPLQKFLSELQKLVPQLLLLEEER